jgi:hypothetical protein
MTVAQRLPGLMAYAEELLARLWAFCVGPAEVAALGWLDAAERREILRWLRPLEALARALVAAERGIPVGPQRGCAPCSGLGGATARGARARAPLPDDPALWTARLSFLAPQPGRLKISDSSAPEPRAFSAAALALRMEAAARAVADPSACALALRAGDPAPPLARADAAWLARVEARSRRLAEGEARRVIAAVESG